MTLCSALGHSKLINGAIKGPSKSDRDKAESESRRKSSVSGSRRKPRASLTRDHAGLDVSNRFAAPSSSQVCSRATEAVSSLQETRPQADAGAVHRLLHVDPHGSVPLVRSPELSSSQLNVGCYGVAESTSVKDWRCDLCALAPRKKLLPAVRFSFTPSRIHAEAAHDSHHNVSCARHRL